MKRRLVLVQEILPLIVSIICLFSLSTAIVFGQGQTLNFTLTHAGYQRSFVLFVPSGYTSGISTPLVFNLHGGGRTAEDQMTWTGMNTLAESEGFLTAYPQAYGGYWWGPSGTDPYDDAGFFDAMISDLSSHYSIDSSRTYVTGLSHGALMTYILTVARPYTFAAAAPVAADRPFSPGTTNYAPLNLPATPNRPFPLLHIHGTDDQSIPYGGGYSAGWTWPSVEKVLEDYAKSNGAQSSPNVVDLPNSNTEDESTVQLLTYVNPDLYLDIEGNFRDAETLLYRIINGGHNWPDMVPPERYPPVNRDINANEVIWDFFSRHVLARPAGDFDEDGDVDGADLVAWQNGFSLSGSALHSDGDADLDQDVDGADFLTWQRQYGLTLSSYSANVLVPEPTTVLLMIVNLLIVVRRN